MKAKSKQQPLTRSATQKDSASKTVSASKTMSATETKVESGQDVAIVCGVSADGKGVTILRKRGEKIEAGTVRTLEPGKPIHGEVVRLTPRVNAPLICDVEVEFAGPNPLEGSEQSLPANASTASMTGPAQVASDQYRKNWDAIYKKRSAASSPSLRSRAASSQTLSAKAKRLLN